MTREELINKIEELNEKYGDNYNLIAIRSQNVEFPEAGSEFDYFSKTWDYENDCESEEELDGACATTINASGAEIDVLLSHFNASGYTGDAKHIAVLGASSKYGYTYGNDPAEVILKYATVLEVIR